MNKDPIVREIAPDYKFQIGYLLAVVEGYKHQLSAEHLKMVELIAESYRKGPCFVVDLEQGTPRDGL